jgi:phosphatidylglycerophosphate synthase
MTAKDDDRRPISQRGRGYAKYLTRMLAGSGVTPNMISLVSIVFAALAGLCFYAIGLATGPIDRVLLCLGAALFCQLRLLANMLDGMVAVEAGKGSPDGPVWNELPDRFADIAVLVGAGYGVSGIAHADFGWDNPSLHTMGLINADSLGWAAAVAAVMTAYVREVGRAAGAPADFSGPMAKPHRMFVMTMAALVAATAPLWGGPHPRFFMSNDAAEMAHIVHAALWIVLIGATFTAFNRARRALQYLRNPPRL